MAWRAFSRYVSYRDARDVILRTESNLPRDSSPPVWPNFEAPGTQNSRYTRRTIVVAEAIFPCSPVADFPSLQFGRTLEIPDAQNSTNTRGMSLLKGHTSEDVEGNWCWDAGRPVNQDTRGRVGSLYI